MLTFVQFPRTLRNNFNKGRHGDIELTNPKRGGGAKYRARNSDTELGSNVGAFIRVPCFLLCSVVRVLSVTVHTGPVSLAVPFTAKMAGSEFYLELLGCFLHIKRGRCSSDGSSDLSARWIYFSRGASPR